MLNVRIATPPPKVPDAPPGIMSSYIWSLKPGDKVIVSGLQKVRPGVTVKAEVERAAPVAQ